jgi:hypothetical protein
VSDQGSVWDNGPQYPELWPDPSGDPADHTPPSPSPVDIDAAPPPEAPAPAPAPEQPPERAWWQGRFLGLATWIWLLVLLVLIAVLALLVTSRGDDDPELVATPTTPAPTAGATSQPTASTQPPATTRPPATQPMTVAPATVPPEATVPPTAAPTTATATTTAAPAPTTVPATTAAPTTIAPTTTLAPTTTVVADGPFVEIHGSTGPCRFGNDCLLAGFTIHEFDVRPTEFVCEFGDGSRYSFRFDSLTVEQACATGDPESSITIEVAGVRSETFRHP